MNQVAELGRPKVENMEDLEGLVSGMTCQSCAMRVTKLLMDVEGLEEIHVDLGKGSVTLKKPSIMPISAIVAAIAVEPKYSYSPILNEVKPSITPQNQAFEVLAKSWLATYKPLLLIVGFILGGVVVREISAGNRFDLMAMMNNFMGGFFVVFGFFKLLDLRGFSDAYGMYDLIAKRVKVWGWIYPLVEVGLGVMFLLRFWPMSTNIVTLILMLLGSLSVVLVLVNKQSIRCACLGTGFNLPMSTVTLIEDGGMAVMSAVMLVSMI